MLHEAARLAEGPLAVPFAEGDRNAPTSIPQTQRVKLPEAIGECGRR